MSRTEAWVWVVLRGFVFVPGAVLSLVTTFGLGYSGFNVVVVFAPLVMVPAAVVCWVQASSGKGGDWWTLGYIAVWVSAIGLCWFGALLFF